MYSAAGPCGWQDGRKRVEATGTVAARAPHCADCDISSQTLALNIGNFEALYYGGDLSAGNTGEQPMDGNNTQRNAGDLQASAYI